MHPHPPKSEKLRNPTRVRQSQIKFPGAGKSLKEPEKKKKPKDSFQSWRDRNIEMKKRSSGTGCSSKRDDGALPPTRELRSRDDSFSHYSPLPAIGSQEEREQKTCVNTQRMSGKRSLPKSAEKQFPQHQNEDMLLSTIKRMKLGMNLLSEPTSSNSSAQNNATNEQLETTTNINLIIRLPKGSKIQRTFSSSDTLENVLKFLSKEMKTSLPLSKYVIYLNEVPKKELLEVKSTLLLLGIKDRSVLTLDTRD